MVRRIVVQNLARWPNWAKGRFPRIGRVSTQEEHIPIFTTTSFSRCRLFQQVLLTSTILYTAYCTETF